VNSTLQRLFTDRGSLACALLAEATAKPSRVKHRISSNGAGVAYRSGLRSAFQPTANASYRPIADPARFGSTDFSGTPVEDGLKALRAIAGVAVLGGFCVGLVMCWIALQENPRGEFQNYDTGALQWETLVPLVAAWTGAGTLTIAVPAALLLIV